MTKLYDLNLSGGYFQVDNFLQRSFDRLFCTKQNMGNKRGRNAIIFALLPISSTTQKDWTKSLQNWTVPNGFCAPLSTL